MTRKLKNLLQVLTAAALIASVGASSSLRADAESMIVHRLPTGEAYRIQEVLSVNKINAERFVVVASKATGVAQIAVLLEQSRFEEQWAFLPDVEVWVEVGRAERADDEVSEVALDVDFVIALAGMHDEIELVHFHPVHYYRAKGWTFVWPATIPVQGWSPEDLGPVALSLPSPADLIESIGVSAELAQAGLTTTIRHTLVTPHGMVTYGLTAHGLKQVLLDIEDPRGRAIQKMYGSYVLATSTHSIGRVADVDESTIGSILKAIADQASTRQYELNYSSFGN